MILRIATLAAFVFAALPSMAQTIAVRSGEHETFTRFVLRLPPGGTWALDRGDRSARLSIGPGTPLFDVQGVFLRIPRSRVSDLRQSAAGAPLEFTLACACEIDTFVHDRDFLVVDIRTPTGPGDPDGAAPRATSLPVLAATTPYRFRRPEPQELNDASGDRTEETLILPLVPEVPAPPSRLPVVEAEPELRLPDAARIAGVRAMERQLSDQIARALDQGLVEQSDTAQQAPDAAASHDSPASTGQEKHPEVDHEPRGNVAVVTTIDRDMAHIAAVIAGQGTPDRCLAPETVALHEWSTGQGYAAETGYWRAHLVGEFDQIDQSAVLALARTYLHYGFGAEARQALGLLEHETDASVRLAALAEIIDTGTTTGRNPFAGQIGCDGDTALWSALSQPARLAEADRKAVVRAIARLPVPLRGYIGAEMAARLAKAGHAEDASTILRSIGRVVEAPAPAQLLAEASTAELMGDAETATRQRSHVAKTNSDKSPEALIDLVENRFAERDTVSPDIPELAAALATEYRNTRFGSPLRRAHALTLGLSGRFADAFGALEVIDASDGAETAGPTRVALLDLLADRAGDIAFLQYGLHHMEGHEPDLPENLGNRLARRLLDLGFSRPAVRLLAGSERNPASVERRRLRAEAALGEDLPHEALIALLGLDDPESARLRARALQMRQDHAQAAAVLIDAEETEAAARSLWLSDRSDTSPGDGDALYGMIAQLTGRLRGSDPELDAMAPLARAQALIDGSTATRGEIDTLLGSVPVEDAAE